MRLCTRSRNEWNNSNPWKSNFSPAAFPNSFTFSPAVLTNVITVFTISTTVETALPKISVFFTVSSSLTRYSPKLPVSDNTPFPAGKKRPINSPIPPATALKACPTISSTANTPLNVFFRFFELSSPILNFAVRSRIRSVISANCFPVIGGKISLNASRTGLATLTSPSKTFFTASIIMVRPPRSFQS